jgi:hypothetical protein
MEELLMRFWENLVDRIGGPMNLRFILQPTMAVLLGIRDGLRYAREGRSFLLWGGPENPAERRAQLLATWRSIGKVFVLAIVLDMICRWIAVNWFFPLETLIVAIGVAVVPYLAVRGSVNWLARSRRARARSEASK